MGTFPRYLGHYVREVGLLTLEDCINHLTGRAAQRLRLAGRGLVRAGYFADLVLFDPAAVTDTATFDNPKQQAAGISHVIVNGECAIEDGRPTDDWPAAPSGWTLQKADRMTTPPADRLAMATIVADRLAVVRAPEIPDPVALADALAQSGIRALELTFTTPGVLGYLRAAATSKAVLGGTVLTADQARAAIDSGANSLSHRGFGSMSQSRRR